MRGHHTDRSSDEATRARHFMPTSPDLNFGFGMSNEIEIPVRIVRSATVRGNHHQAFTVAEVKQRHLVGPPRSTTGGGQEQHVVVDQSPTDESSGQSIDMTMPAR